METKTSIEGSDIKILHVYPYFSRPMIGGMEVVLYNLTTAMAMKRDKVTILAGNINALRTKTWQIGGVTVIQVPVIRVANYLEIPIFKARKVLMNNDVIHVHALGHFFTNFIATQTLLLGTKCVVSVLSLKYMVKHLPFFAKLIGFILVSWARWIARNSDLIQVKNQEDYEDICSFCETSKVVIIPDGISSDFFNEQPSEREFRLRNLFNGKKVILFVGRLHKHKGIVTLAESFRHIVRRYPSAMLLYVGDGPHAGLIRRRASELGIERHIVFTGYLSEEEKIAAYDVADVVVIPSHNDFIEAYCIVLSEAWARRKPVVASAVGALKYRIKDGANGLLTKPKEPDELAQKVLQILKDDGIRKKIILNSEKDVYPWYLVAQALKESYGKARLMKKYLQKE